MTPDLLLAVIGDGGRLCEEVLLARPITPPGE
jgi:hypothetical protein